MPIINTAKKSVKKNNQPPLRKEKKIRLTSRKPKIRKEFKRMTHPPQLLRGMKDILPADQKYWDFVRDKFFELSACYSFSRIDTPILEEEILFKRSIGDATDIVAKEMFNFLTLGGEKVVLRPEATASVARAYIEHGMINQPQPVKLAYMGPMFRYDRPQSGRQRQFHQVGWETIGEFNMAVDVQLIFMVYRFFQELGLNVTIGINSIGCGNCRPNYRKVLVDYYRGKRSKLCEDCRDRVNKNPLRVLDCKNPDCQELKSEAPQIVDWLCEECGGHFTKILEYLDELGVAYNLDPYLVRGLDYYTKTVFEVFSAELVEDGSRAPLALGGGGRYDSLIEMLGGRDVPACGVALGVERIVSLLKNSKIEAPIRYQPQVFLAQIGDQAKRKAFKLFEELRQEDIRVVEFFAKDSLKSQLEYADRLGVKYVLILGQKEVLDGTILLRDMEGGIQEIISLEKVVNELKKKFTKI